MFFRNEKIKINEREDTAKLDALVSVSKTDVRGFREIAERHYGVDERTGDLYPIPSSKVSFFLGRGNSGFVYDCSKTNLLLHTSQGYLDSSINRNNQLSVNAQGQRQFVRDFYDYLVRVSHRR